MNRNALIFCLVGTLQIRINEDSKTSQNQQIIFVSRFSVGKVFEDVKHGEGWLLWALWIITSLDAELFFGSFWYPDIFNARAVDFHGRYISSDFVPEDLHESSCYKTLWVALVSGQIYDKCHHKLYYRWFSMFCHWLFFGNTQPDSWMQDEVPFFLILFSCCFKRRKVSDRRCRAPVWM